MSQSRRIFNNTVALTVAYLFNKGGNMVLALLISRLFHATGLGIYAAAIAYYDLIALVGGMGAKDFLVREIAKDRSMVNHYVVHASIVGTASSAAAMALFAIVLPFLGYSPETQVSLYIIIPAILPGALRTIQEAVFIAHQRVALITYTRFVATIVHVGVCVYLLTHGYGVASLLVAFVVIEYLVMFCFFFLIHRYVVPLRLDFRLSAALRLVWEMRAFTAMSLLASLFVKPEVILLSLVQDEAQVGFYSAAIRLVGFWYFISQMYMTNVYPVLSRFYHLADERFQTIQDKSIKYLLAISLPLTAGIVAASEPIITLLYGPGFETAALLLQILAWNIPLAFVSAVLWRALAARNEQNAVLWVRVITLVTRLGGAYLFIRWWGALGAAIIAPLNLVLNALLLAAFFRRGGSRLRVLRLGWRFALAALGMGLSTWALRDYLSLWALVPVAGVIYVVLILALRAFSSDDLILFRRLWKPEVAGGSQ